MTVMAMGSPIKSIQYVTFTSNGSSYLTFDVTITAVNLTYSIIIPLGGNSDHNAAGNNDGDSVRLSLEDATTARATRKSAEATYNYSWNAVVIEFRAAAVKSVQRHTISLAAETSKTATLSPAVVVAKSVIFSAGDLKWSNLGIAIVKLTLTNTTTVTATLGDRNSTTVGFAVVVFK